MTNQIFSQSRFLAYLKKHIYDTRSRLAINAGIILMLPILFCVGIPAIRNCYDYPPMPHLTIADPMWGNEILFFIFFAPAIGAAFGSVFYETMKRKTSRIATLTNPASQLEKFVAYFCIYILFFSIISIASLFLADAIRVWIYSGTQNPGIKVGYLTPDMLFTMGATIPKPDEITPLIADVDMVKSTIIFSSIALLQAVYALGCAVWPRNSFLKTTALLFSLNMASGYLLFLGFQTFVMDEAIVPRFDLQIGTVTLSIAVISAALAIFIWWIGYRRFCESEVVERW